MNTLTYNDNLYSIDNNKSREPQQQEDYIMQNNKEECSQETIEKTIKKNTKNKLKLKTKTTQKELTNVGVYES